MYPEVKIDKSIIVETDTKWFQFIIGQMLSNAIKYSSGSKKRLK